MDHWRGHWNTQDSDGIVLWITGGHWNTQDSDGMVLWITGEVTGIHKTVME